MIIEGTSSQARRHGHRAVVGRNVSPLPPEVRQQPRPRLDVAGGSYDGVSVVGNSGLLHEIVGGLHHSRELVLLYDCHGRPGRSVCPAPN